MSKRKVNTEEELAKAINEGADEIYIEGDLAKKTIRIKATGKVAYTIAIAAIAVAVAAIVLAAPTGGTSAVVGIVASAPVATAFGTAATAAVAIAVASGGVAVLNKLRDYRIIEQSENHVILKKYFLTIDIIFLSVDFPYLQEGVDSRPQKTISDLELYGSNNHPSYFLFCFKIPIYLI